MCSATFFQCFSPKKKEKNRPITSQISSKLHCSLRDRRESGVISMQVKKKKKEKERKEKIKKREEEKEREVKGGKVDDDSSG